MMRRAAPRLLSSARPCSAPSISSLSACRRAFPPVAASARPSSFSSLVRPAAAIAADADRRRRGSNDPRTSLQLQHQGAKREFRSPAKPQPKKHDSKHSKRFGPDRVGGGGDFRRERGGGGRGRGPAPRPPRPASGRDGGPARGGGGGGDGGEKVAPRPFRSIAVEGRGKVNKYCYGCGATIAGRAGGAKEGKKEGTKGGGGGVQVGLTSTAGGYWKEKKEELRISRIKNWALCPRCAALNEGGGAGEAAVADEQLKALAPTHEMTQVFREQVGKIRSKKDVVVVLCVDAADPRASLVRNLRNLVGGNPILLAVTRCDLLPDHVREGWDEARERRAKEWFKGLAGGMDPADVYLCSVPEEDDEEGQAVEGERDVVFDGAERLANDLWEGLDGRDVYVVGAANIGKSTLTDRLVNNLLRYSHVPDEDERGRRKMTEKERKRQRYGVKTDRERDRRRYDTLRHSRITRSSLPGTTLQNVRVPCLPNFEQALWDTPGLVLDSSIRHYPVQNLLRIRATRPERMVTQWHEVERKAFALLVLEAKFHRKEEPDNVADSTLDTAILGTPDFKVLPLIRIEIRLKKKKEARHDGDTNPGPVLLAWNSTFNEILTTSVADIEECRSAERRRLDALSAVDSNQRAFSPPVKKEGNKEDDQSQRDEELIQTEVQKPEQYEQLGEDDRHEQVRQKRLSSLKLVSEDVIEAEKTTEIAVANLGSLTLRAQEPCLVRVFAPSSGVRPVCGPAMVVPHKWEGDVFDNIDDQDVGDEDVDFSVWATPPDDLWGRDDGDGFHDFVYENYGDIPEAYLRDSESEGHSRKKKSYHDRSYHRPRRWEEFSGTNIGWVFDEKPIYVRGALVDGWRPVEKQPKEEEVAAG